MLTTEYIGTHILIGIPLPQILCNISMSMNRSYFGHTDDKFCSFSKLLSCPETFNIQDGEVLSAFLLEVDCSDTTESAICESVLISLGTHLTRSWHSSGNSFKLISCP